MPFYAEPWISRAVMVADALGSLIDAHGSPNRFQACEVSEMAGLSMDTVYRVGRHGGEISVRGSVCVYRRGWFEAQPSQLASSTEGG